MKRIITCAAAIALAAGTAFASGVADGRYGVWTPVRAKGPVIEKEIYVTSFDAVAVSGVGKVRWKAGPAPKLVVRTHESLFEHLDCGTDGGRLKLGFRPGVSVSGLQVLEFDLTSPAFGSLDLSGAADFQALSPWETDDLDIVVSGSGSVEAEVAAERARIRLSGSGTVRLAGDLDQLGMDLSGSGAATVRDLDADRVALVMSGGGEVTLAGKAEALELDLSGSAAVAAKGLEARRVKARLAGAGRVETTAADSLEVDASGAASVLYWGTPTVTARTSGSADIRPGT